MSDRKSDLELDERSAEAKFILNHPLFGETMTILRNRYISELISSPIGSEKSTVCHAKLVILDDIVGQFKTVITDQKMTSQKRPDYGH